MNYQYINQHYQSTVETATAISNMFVKQKIEIKHMHNGCGCGKDLCLFLWSIMAQTTQ